MHRHSLFAAPLLLVGVLPLNLSAAEPAFLFRDVAASAGILPAAEGILGHGAGWGDVDGDGWADLYIGTFHRASGKPNMLLRNRDGQFHLDDQPALRISTRATGALFADLDNDGDLDLYVSSMPQPKNNVVGCTLFRNDGDGRFTNIAQGNAACPESFGGRSATALDYDGDGLLDILVGEEPVAGYNGSKTHATRLFRNLGKLQFEDVSRAAGIPADTPGLGVAAADVNNDTWPDIFIAANDGGNLLLLNDHGKFKLVESSRKLFDWPGSGGDNMVCGVSFGDVNRDGWLDLALGPHFASPWIEPQSPRLFLNRGREAADQPFTEITQDAGLTPIPLKAPHVELQDFDNDGWVDLSTSVVKFAGNRARPVIYRNQGDAGPAQFKEDALGVNDFPTAADRSIKRSGDFFKKMIAEGKIIYTAPGPTCDFDNDGRLDMFLANWWVERPSMLLRNETPGGHWLQVQVEGPPGVNRMGVGARIYVYRAGKLGDAQALIGCGEIATGFGYASSHVALAHFGLGEEERVDLRIVYPHGKGTVEQKDVAPNQRLTIKKGERGTLVP